MTVEQLPRGCVCRRALPSTTACSRTRGQAISSVGCPPAQSAGRWRSRRPLSVVSETRVYPTSLNCRRRTQAIDLWLNRLGVRQQPRRLGLEFHQLREFREGDTLRQIDWKATARSRTIAREYQDERDQQSC